MREPEKLWGKEKGGGWLAVRCLRSSLLKAVGVGSEAIDPGTDSQDGEYMVARAILNKSAAQNSNIHRCLGWEGVNDVVLGESTENRGTGEWKEHLRQTIL